MSFIRYVICKCFLQSCDLSFLFLNSVFEEHLMTGYLHACMHAKLIQSCPILCDSVAFSWPGSSVHGILQARILEWVGLLFSRWSLQPRNWTCVSSISCIGRQVLYHLWYLKSWLVIWGSTNAQNPCFNLGWLWSDLLDPELPMGWVGASIVTTLWVSFSICSICLLSSSQPLFQRIPYNNLLHASFSLSQFPGTTPKAGPVSAFACYKSLLCNGILPFCCCSVTKSCLTLCVPLDCSTPTKMYIEEHFGP